MRRTAHLRWTLAAALSTGALSGPVALAQVHPNDPSQSVYVRDSAVAMEKFALAQRMEHLKEWTKAADVYQEMLSTQADKVIASKTEDDHPTQYQSVIAAVQDKLCAWPAEGLDVYRGRFEAEAAGLLDQAKAENRAEGVDDPALLHRVLTNFFVTDAGKNAGIRLIDLYVENADFAAAAWTGQHLLTSHPQLGDDRAAILFRTAIANHFAGNDSLAQQEQAELHDKFPQVIGKVRGVDAVLADTIVDLLKTPVQVATVSGTESWPMPFGSPDRSRIPSTTGTTGAWMYKVDVVDTLPKGAVLTGPIRTQFKQEAANARSTGSMTGILPVVDNGELFFQDNVRVYARSLESGLPLPGWQQTYPDHNGCYAINGWVTPRNHQESLCVTDDSVYAILGQADASGLGLTNIGRDDTRLTCLDRHTGKLKWETRPQQFPADPQALRQLDLSGSPLVVGENVYLIARGGRNMQFEDCYIICLHASDGTFKWARYLASANSSDQMEIEVNGPSASTNISHIAFSGGRLYVTTNVGAVAAVDAYDGTVLWLNLYPRSNDPSRMMAVPQRWGFGGMAGGGMPEVNKPWTYNPTIVKDGKVFVLPSDGKFVHIYDAGDGTEIKRIKMTGLGPAGIETGDTLIGIGDERGDALLVASAKTVYCFDWPNYDVKKKPENNLKWYKSFGFKQAGEDTIRGRAFATRDSVYVPLAWGMSCLSLKTGSTKFSYPPSEGATWDEKNEGPGNIVVTQDHLIIAGPQRVSVYTDMGLATAKLDTAIAASPSDPTPQLRYAEILFVARKRDEAMARLDKAAALIHPATAPATESTSQPDSPTQGTLAQGTLALGTLSSVSEATGVSARERLFADCLKFAQELTSDNSEAAMRDTDALYDKAAAAAATPGELVTYRLQRAEYAHQRIRTNDELALYQSILGDVRLRGVSVTRKDDTGASPAGSIARTAITDLLQRAGVAIYQPFEQQAQTQLAAIRASDAADKPEQMVALAEAYPNSTTARGAMLDAADAYEGANNPHASAAVLRQFNARYPDSPERTRVIESLARAYLKMPNRAQSLSVAIGRLEQAAKLSSQPQLTKPLPMPDGTTLENVTFLQAADALRKFQVDATTRTLPDPKIPLRKSKEKGGTLLPDDPAATISNVQAMVPPIHDWARHDRVVTYSTSGELAVYAVGSTQPLMSSKVIDQQPRNVAWIGSNLLVWCPNRLVLLRTEGPATAPSQADGQVIWNSALASLPATQVASMGGGADDAITGTDTGDQQEVGPGQQVIVNGQRIMVRGNARVFIGRGNGIRVIGPNGIVRLVNQPAAANANVEPAAVEQISKLIPGSDRIVFATSGGESRGGRVVSLAVADGKVQWQTRSDDHGIDQLLANDDFVVVRTSNDTDVRIAAFDAQGGQPIWRPKPWLRESADTGVPVNCALAEDGSLVFLLPDHVCCKDLFDADPKLRFDRSITHNNGANLANTFTEASASDQLVISDGRILAVSDAGTFVRLYSLFDGKPYKIPSKSKSGDSEGILGTQVVQDPWNAHMRVVGNQMYVFGRSNALHYNLNDLDDTAPMTAGPGAASNVNRDVVVTRDHLITIAAVTLGDRPLPADQLPRQLIVQAYSRAVINGTESSRASFSPRAITESSGIEDAQVVDGGIYYVTGDHKLKLVRGSIE